MEKLNIYSNLVTINRNKNLEIKKVVKKRKLRDLNKEPSKIISFKFIKNAIDNENIDEIEKLRKNIKINDKNDIILDMYNNKLLTSERLQFITKKCTKYLNVSSNLIKKLIKDEKIIFLDIIFSNLNFCSNETILRLLFYYRNKTVISTSCLNQQISNENFKISVNFDYSFNNIGKYLINECNKKNINIYIIKFLVEHGADVNKKSYNGATSIFYACKMANEAVVKYLVEHGADLNKTNHDGNTPLFIACLSGNEAIVKYLVEHGADINKENMTGNTPLFKACLSGNEAVVNYLVELGADVNKKSYNGTTPLFYACSNGNNEAVVKYLVEHGANINKDINYYEETPLFKACESGNVAIVKYLVEHGADINKVNNNDETPLFNACKYRNESVVNYLIEIGADINKMNIFGETPLLYTRRD